MKCSCKTYERHGYPCHHLLHVVGCESIHDVQKEWIDICWTKEYLLKYLHKYTSEETNNVYTNLRKHFLPGIRFVSPHNASYPIYKGFEGRRIDNTMFNVPTFQFMTQDTKMLWIAKNDTSDPKLQQLLKQTDTDYVNHRIFLSQEQALSQQLSQQQNNQSNDDSFDNQDEDNSDIDSSTSNDNIRMIMNFSENNALFKRAFQLANNNEQKHRQLYTLLSNFVIENEINHDDNEEVINNRENGKKVIVSSNKIVNTSKRSNKRKKGSWE